MWQIQNILVYLAVLAAVIYLVKKFLFKKKKNTSPGCGGADCKCD